MKSSDFDEKILISKAEDAARQALRRGSPVFTGFLSDAERAIIQCHAHYERDEETLMFFGGYPEADYTVAGFFPAYCFYEEEFRPEKRFPIRMLHAAGSGFRKLSHRDFLGSLMALGIKRETVGDIAVAPDGFSAYIFCLEKTAEYLIGHFTMAANDKIICRPCDPETVVLPAKQFTVINTTVSSLRADAILCAALDISREEAARLIAAGLVSVNHLLCRDKSELCPEGAVFSVRHHGRFLLYRLGDRNKKDRLRITLHRYV